jgi:hypothetical protein
LLFIAAFVARLAARRKGKNGDVPMCLMRPAMGAETGRIAASRSAFPLLGGAAAGSKRGAPTGRH